MTGVYSVENADNCRQVSFRLERRGDITPVLWALSALERRSSALLEDGMVTAYDPQEVYAVYRSVNLAFSSHSLTREVGSDGTLGPWRKIDETARTDEDPGEAHLSFAEAGMVLAALWTWIDTVSAPDYAPAEPLDAIGREDLAALNEAADQFAAALAPQKNSSLLNWIIRPNQE